MLTQSLQQIESTQADVQIKKAMETANSTLKDLQKQVSIEDWEKIYDDFADIEAQQEQEREFFGEILKDDDLLAELEAMDAGEEAEAIPDAGVAQIDVPKPAVVQ